MILGMVSPVTHSVGNCLKRVVVIVSSVIFFQTPVSPINTLGKIDFIMLIQFVTANLSCIRSLWNWVIFNFRNWFGTRWSLPVFKSKANEAKAED